MVAHIGTGLWWNQFGWNRCFWSEPETLRGVRWACVAMLDPVTAGSTERFMSREEKRSKWHFRNSSLAVVCRLDRGGKRWNCILMEENSRTWWLTGKEGQERSGRSMPKETKLFGQVQHQNNFVKSWKPWEQAINDSINFLYPPKAWASPGTSPFWWSHPLASYSTQFSPTPPPHQKALFCSKQEHFLEPSLSLKPVILPQGGTSPSGFQGGSAFYLTFCEGQAGLGEWDRWKLAFFHLLFFWAILSFSHVSAPVVKTLSLCLSYFSSFSFDLTLFMMILRYRVFCGLTFEILFKSSNRDTFFL